MDDNIMTWLLMRFIETTDTFTAYQHKKAISSPKKIKIALRVIAIMKESEGHLTRKSGVLPIRYPAWQHTFVSPSAFSRRAVVSYW